MLAHRPGPGSCGHDASRLKQGRGQKESALERQGHPVDFRLWWATRKRWHMREAKLTRRQLSQPSVQSLLDELRPILSGVTKASIRGAGIYGCVLRASVAKSFEFAELVHCESSLDHSFFMTSTLRGICEDLIVLSFVAQLSPAERDEVVELLMVKNATDGMAAQSAFFKSIRPWQPVLEPQLEAPTDKEVRLNTLAHKLGWRGGKPWPTVWFMANACSLKPLYSYIYAATSKWVHFSPQVLLRMGWGQGSTLDDVSDDTEWSFTTTNFAGYYSEFNQTYALMLLLHLVRGPARCIVPSDTASTISALKTHLDSSLRWPEDVTFEEMNQKGPSSFQRILLRAALDTGSADPS